MYSLEDIFQFSKKDIKEILNKPFTNINQGRYFVAKKFYSENKLEYSDKICIYYLEISNENKFDNFVPEELYENTLNEISLIKKNLNKTEKFCLKWIPPLIGKGSTGIVFYPALETLDYNFVSKVGFINDLTGELKNIKILPEYINSYEITLLKVPAVYKEQIIIASINIFKRLKVFRNFEKNQYYEEDKKYLNEQFGNFTSKELKDINHEEFVKSLDTDLYQLKMNYISGITIHNFIEDNLHHEDNYPSLIYFNNFIKYKIQKISSKKLYPLIRALCHLFFLVKKMNEELIFHNDLHPNNLMYDGNEVILIDFEKLTTGKEKLHPGTKNDQDSLMILVKILLLCGGMGSKFERFLKEYGIIKEFKTSINIFLFDREELINKLLECLE
uniref:Protein kinase domain-containing protein n=1 Tax=viral metagenome TaxID=1070528 RepID=A0A6C0AFE9_9ZZZZ